MDQPGQGKDVDLRRALESAIAERAESPEAESPARPEDKEQRGQAAAGAAPTPDPKAAAETREALAALNETLERAEVQRRALAGLISDAADVHRALRAGGAGTIAPPAVSGAKRPGLRRRLRGRLARTPLAAPVRAVRRRARRNRPVGAQAEGRSDDDSDREGHTPALKRPDALDPPPSPVVRLAGPPVAVEVEGLAKSFTVPSKQLDSFKERLVRHPFTRIERRRLDVLRDVSFTVAQGEFIGLVGTNGAGKSTLLKAIAGIYQSDRGSVRVAGRVAPLIELGVGFRSDLSARDNVILSATMLGLSPDVARERYPAVLDFAGLEEFAELKLRNYSSGMRVRLAFAVMMQVEADVFLIDEVLSVGDAEFQERCTQAMRELHEAGKTIFFVSHSMGKVKANCERGILLDEGRVEMIGTPDALAERYAELIATRRKQDRPDRLPSLPAIGGTGGR